MSGKRWSTHVSTPLNGPAPVTGSFFCVAAIESGSLRVFADDELGLADELVRRDGQVVRRRFVLVDTARKIEQRAVARTVETAVPLRVERLRLLLETIYRRTAEMRADTDEDQILRLERAIFVVRVSRLLAALAGGVRDAAVVLLHCLQHFRRASHDPHRLTTPFNGFLLAGHEIAQIDFDRRPSRLGALRGQHAPDERH